MYDNHTLMHIPYLIAKPDSLAVLLWSTISIGNFLESVCRVGVTKIQM